MSKDKFEFGEEFDLDSLRTEVNIRKILSPKNSKFYDKVKRGRR